MSGTYILSDWLTFFVFLPILSSSDYCHSMVQVEIKHCDISKIVVFAQNHCISYFSDVVIFFKETWNMEESLFWLTQW